MFAQVHVYDSADQVKASIDTTRNLIANGELVACQRAVATVVSRSAVPPLIPAGGGGFAWAQDESVQSSAGRVDTHKEEYAWQFDNLLIRVEFQGRPGYVIADRVRDGLQAISDAAKQVSGR